jgi:long-chain acyl-CoA synthetase
VQKGLAQLSPPQRAIARWAVRTGERSLQGDTLDRRDSRALQLAERLALRRLRIELGFDDAKLLASGAAPLAPEVIRFFAAIGLPIHEIYGQTENCGCTSMNRRGSARIGTVGTALRGNEIRIAEDGEILVKGQVVFSGYFKEVEATRETLTDGWLHTGDVGEVDAAGYLRITDRKKDLIITAGGKNISPSNIEQLLAQHKLVGHAVAIGDRRPYVSALLTLDPEESAAFAKQHGLGDDLERVAESDEVRRELETHVQAVNGRLSHVEQVKKWRVVPGAFEVGDELTPTMKVKRKVVAEKYGDQIEQLYER